MMIWFSLLILAAAANAMDLAQLFGDSLELHPTAVGDAVNKDEELWEEGRGEDYDDKIGKDSKRCSLG